MIYQCGLPRPRIVSRPRPCSLPLNFHRWHGNDALSPLLAILAFAPKLAICTRGHRGDMTPFTQCTTRLAFGRNPTAISSAAYPRRITGYSNPCAFTGAANVTVKADTFQSARYNPYSSARHTQRLRFWRYPHGLTDASMIGQTDYYQNGLSPGSVASFCIEKPDAQEVFIRQPFSCQPDSPPSPYIASSIVA